MKATTEQRDTLAAAIAPLNTEYNRQMYREGRFHNAHKVKDLDMRFRWDLLHASGGWQLTAPLYDAGLNDMHIDTVLRSIVAPLGDSQEG